jgi:hypothetical protein
MYFAESRLSSARIPAALPDYQKAACLHIACLGEQFAEPAK